MGTSSRSRFALATVALLLDLTVADIMLQPGYSKAENGQPMVQQPQQQQQDQMQMQPYSTSQNPTLQFLQQQHALQRSYLEQKHKDQHQELLQLQQQELQQVAKTPPQGSPAVNENVGSMWGGPGLLHGAGGLHGGKMFSLTPMGLNSFTFPGIGGFGHSFPLLLSTHHNPQMTESSQLGKSVDESKNRDRREIRDSGESKRYRQRQSRPQQQNGVETPTVKSKSDADPQNDKSSKSSGDKIVGDVHQQGSEENVGSPGGLLDPLGLMDKAESMIDDLRTGHLPNPMEMLNRGGGGGGLGGGLLPGLPHWLQAANPMSTPTGNQPMLGQQQQYNPYQMQQGASGPLVGNSRNFWTQPMFQPSAMYGSYTPYGAASYGSWGSPYQMYLQPYSAMGPWARQSNFMGSQMIGAANPISGGNAQPVAEKAASGSQGRSSPMNGMNDNTFVGAQNPSVGGANPNQFQPLQRSMNGPGSYNQMTPGQNQMAVYHQLARNAMQAMQGTNPMAGSPGAAKTTADAAPSQNPQMVGSENPMTGRMNEFYDPNFQNNYYDNGQFGYNDFNGDLQKHRRPGFDFDDVFDTGYGHGHGGLHSGSYDRIYETTSVHGHPYGYGGGVIPHLNHGHQSSYII